MAILAVIIVVTILIWGIAAQVGNALNEGPTDKAHKSYSNPTSSYALPPRPARPRRVDKSEAQRLLNQAKSSVQTVNTTTDPETFFKRLHFTIDLLLELQSYEGRIPMRGMTPTQNLNQILNNLEATVNDFIERSYLKEISAAKSLKTDKARQQRMERYFAKMKEAFKRSSSHWGGSYTSHGQMPHYDGKLYTDANLVKLQNLMADSSREATTPLSISALNGQTEHNFKALSASTVNGRTERKSKIVNVSTKKWREVAAKAFTAIDIETTGLSRGTDHIIELAAIRYEEGIERDKFVSLVRPPIVIPQEAIDIHHITNTMVRNASPISDVLPKFLEFVGDSLLVGHNVNFDVGFIEVDARELGFDPQWNYIDTISVAKKIIPGLPNYKQATVVQALGISQPIAHRAEADCRACAEILIQGLRVIS